jgi:hypothetical protein
MAAPELLNLAGRILSHRFPDRHDATGSERSANTLQQLPVRGISQVMHARGHDQRQPRQEVGAIVPSLSGLSLSK